MLVLAALAGAATTGATASAATPPPAAAISDSLEYIGRVPDSSQIVEGKFDTVMGRDVLVTTGTYGFRIYDVKDAAHPKALDTLQPPEVLGKNGYWQDEDMELDVRRKLIIGALDPRHDDVNQADCPGIGTAGDFPAKVRSLGLKGMRERFADLGGSFEITTAPRGGTRLRLRVPLRAGSDAA